MFDFRKVYDVANHLSIIDSEEFNRSAISRYYYSIFCCARLYLILVLGENSFFDGKDIHKRVSKRLSNSNDFTEVSIGYILDDLRYLRNLADYDWYEKDSSFFKRKLDFVSKESKFGLEQIDALRSSPPFVL